MNQLGQARVTATVLIFCQLSLRCFRLVITALCYESIQLDSSQGPCAVYVDGHCAILAQ